MRGYIIKIFILEFVVLIAGCGGSVVQSSDLSTSANKSEQISENVINDVEMPTPTSAESAKVLSMRGDAIFVEGDTLFRGASAGLVIQTLDKNTWQLRNRGILYLPDSASDVLVYKNVAFVASGPQGIFVVDVANLDNPRALSTIKTTGAAIRLERDGDRLIVACGSAGVLIIDVTKPDEPRPLVEWTSEGYVRHAILSEGIVYVAEGRIGVSKLRYDGADTLEHEWRFKTVGQVRAVCERGNKLLVADGPKGLAVLNIGDTDPKEVGRIVLKDMARDVIFANDNKAFIAGGDDGIIVVDLTDLKAIKNVAAFVPDRPANRLRLLDHYLYVGNDSAGSLILDIVRPEMPVKVFPAAQ